MKRKILSYLGILLFFLVFLHADQSDLLALHMEDQNNLSLYETENTSSTLLPETPKAEPDQDDTYDEPVESSDFTSLALLPTFNLSQENLTNWVGSYYYDDEECGYYIHIYQYKGYYYAELEVVGWMVGINALLEVEGDSNHLNFYLVEYMFNSGKDKELGDLFFTFTIQDGKIKTVWEQFKPYNLSATEAFFFVKQADKPFYLIAYQWYLNGSVMGSTGGLSIFDFLDKDSSIAEYALHDINEDGLPELFIRQEKDFIILTYFKGKLVEMPIFSQYSFTIDGDSSVSAIIEDNIFIVNGISVSYLEWKEKIDKYLTLLTYEMVWLQLTDEVAL